MACESPLLKAGPQGVQTIAREFWQSDTPTGNRQDDREHGTAHRGTTAERHVGVSRFPRKSGRSRLTPNQQIRFRVETCTPHEGVHWVVMFDVEDPTNVLAVHNRFTQPAADGAGWMTR